MIETLKFEISGSRLFKNIIVFQQTISKILIGNKDVCKIQNQQK